MATFVMLSRLSPEGMKTLRDNPQRIQEVNREVEGLGARVVQQYALLGHHDFITVLEAPDAETVSRVSVELSSRATATYETLPAIAVDEFVARLRGEGGHAQEGGRAREGELLQDEGRLQERGRSGSTAGPTEGDAALPPREQAREDVQDIKEEIRSEEAPRRRTEEGPPRAGEATPQGRERGDQSERARDYNRSGQPESDRDDDRSLVIRAKDAGTGSEEEPRRREGTERTDQK
jgi:uncharacterized protein with GYD domain